MGIFFKKIRQKSVMEMAAIRQRKDCETTGARDSNCNCNRNEPRLGYRKLPACDTADYQTALPWEERGGRRGGDTPRTLRPTAKCNCKIGTAEREAIVPGPASIKKRLDLFASDLLEQPGAREIPIIIKGGQRNSKNLRRLLIGHASKIPQFD